MGPGLGALTIPLSGIARRLVAVELDRRLAEELARKVPPNVLVVVGDGIQHLLSAREEVLLSNTPFSVTSRLLLAAARNNRVRRAVMGMQLEVARRVVAEPSEPEYGRLTAIIRAHFKAVIVMIMPPSWFSPRPKVSAAVVSLTRVRPWDAVSDSLETLARCVFTRRNRLASRALESCLGFYVNGLGRRRVRDLSPTELLELARLRLKGQVSAP